MRLLRGRAVAPGASHVRPRVRRRTWQATFAYYQPLYSRAGLAYAPPARLWDDDVVKEAQRYQQWAKYYDSSTEAAALPPLASGATMAPLPTTTS